MVHDKIIFRRWNKVPGAAIHTEDEVNAIMRHREYLLRCEPYVRIMCDLHCMQSVRYQMRELPGGGYGEMETEVLWREKDKQLYDQCQEMIDHIRKQYQPGGG